VRVFAFEGEGGLTTGASHETRNTAWGLGLDNLVYVVDWNDEGIDPRRCSSVVYGGPSDWFGAAGWKVVGAENGSDWEPVAQALVEGVHGSNAESARSAFGVARSRVAATSTPATSLTGRRPR
jgi:transketolase